MTRESDPGPETTERTRSARVRGALLAALALAALTAAVVGCVVLSRVPPALTDETALTLLPEGAEILSRHERDGGRTWRVEYCYTEGHAWCAVLRTEARAFRREGDSWVLDGEPETLDEREDWTGLTGCWTERTRGQTLCLWVTGFDGGALTGTVLYQADGSSWEGPLQEAFGPGQRTAGGQPWLFRGTGFFRYNYLRIDRDGGVYFDNDLSPMVWSALPDAQAVPQEN